MAIQKCIPRNNIIEFAGPFFADSSSRFEIQRPLSLKRKQRARLTNFVRHVA
jgi:hypothetical protein